MLTKTKQNCKNLKIENFEQKEKILYGGQGAGYKI